jgi:hypothetical protein
MPVQAQTPYQFRTLLRTTFSVTGGGDQVLSPSINNLGDILWAGQTQGGPRIYLNSPFQNLAALVPNAGTLTDTRLPRFGTKTAHAVWNGSTGEIDPINGTASPGSGYQEDRIYLAKPGAPAPTVIGATRFGSAFNIVTSPDVNDAGQAVFRQLNYPTGQWSLLVHDGSGSLSGTTAPLTGYNLINTTFINNSGKVTFFGRAASSDPNQLHVLDLATGSLSKQTTSLALSNPSLRDFSNDDLALVFDGSSLSGSMYTVALDGTTTRLFTAGTDGLSRVELGQRNQNGQIVFSNRTITATGGANPNAGRSDLMLYDDGAIYSLTNHAPGTAVTAANINDRGDIVYVTQQFLYDSNGIYTGQRQFDLIVATAVPEPGLLLLCGALTLAGIPVLLRRMRSCSGTV